MLPSLSYIPQTQEQLRLFTTTIETLINQSEKYLKGVKRYEKKEFSMRKEKTENDKNISETMLDQLEDIKERNNLFLMDIDEFLLKIEQMRTNVENMKKKCMEDKRNCETKIESFQEYIRETIEMMKENEMKKVDEEIEELKKKKMGIEKEYNEMSKQYQTMKTYEMIDCDEVKQLEEWTEKQCGDILFDSDKDNWSLHTSAFDSKMLGKSHFVIIVEDEEKNKFGYYTPKKIEQIGEYSNDSNAFLFSLKSNGRLNGMMKFESVKSEFGSFILLSKSDSKLFGIWNGFYIIKDNDKMKSYCHENIWDKYYDFHEQQYPLIGKPGKSEFTPRRILVIQMI